MSFQKKRYDVVDISRLPPIEKLDPDQLKKFSKDELTAYLRLYDIDPEKTKPELKRQLRFLISQVKNGTVAIRPVEYSSSPSSSSHDQSSIRRPYISPNLQTPTATRSGLPISSVAGRSSPLSSQSSTPINQRPNLPTDVSKSSHAGTVSSTPRTDNPNAFEPLIASHVLDHVAATSIEKNAKPYLAHGHSYYIESFITRHDHLQYAPKDYLVFKTAEPEHYYSTDDLTCTTCGKRSNKECKFRKCKNCCNAMLLRCSVHARNLVLQPGQSLTEQAESEASAQGTSPQIPIQSTTPIPRSTLPKPIRPSAPVVSRPFHTTLGDRESSEPWREVREESIYRSSQNILCMENIFDYRSTSLLSANLADFSNSRRKASYQTKLDSVIETKEHDKKEYNDKIKKLKEEAERFYEKYETLEKMQFDDERLPSFQEAIQDLAPEHKISIFPKKRTSSDVDLPVPPTSKIQAT